MKIRNEIPLIPPPHNTELEKAVLGAIISYRNAFEEAKAILKPESFYDPSHQEIFKALIDLSNNEAPIDSSSITNELKKRGKIDNIGGIFYLNELVDHAVTVGHIKWHIREVEEFHIRRKLIQQAHDFITSLYDTNMDIDNVFSEMKSAIGNVEDHACSVEVKNIRQCLSEGIEFMEEADKLGKADLLPGIPTGFKSLDYVIGGWRKGTVSIVAARTGIGKTSLALQFLKECAKTKKHVLFISYEMIIPMLIAQLLTAESGVNRTISRDGKMNESEWGMINKAVGVFERLNIDMVDDGSTTIDSIKTLITSTEGKNKYDLVIIDYIGLVKAPSYSRFNNNTDRISEISGQLKQIANMNRIPIICLAQLNRETEKNDEPQLVNLRDSGAIEQDADVVLLPYWGECDGKKQLKIKVAKNRFGQAGGSINIYPNDQFNVFYERKPEAEIKLNTLYNPDRSNSPIDNSTF